MCALHEQVLENGLARDADPVPEADVRPNTRADDDLRFTPHAAMAEEAVRSGRAVAAFFLPGTTTDRIRGVIARGERMPQKSTFFWPKPRTGMVIRPFD